MKSIDISIQEFRLKKPVDLITLTSYDTTFFLNYQTDEHLIVIITSQRVFKGLLLKHN